MANSMSVVHFVLIGFLVRGSVAEALPSVAEALPSGCGGSACFLQKQSQLLVLGLRLEFDKRNIPLELSLR